MGSQENEGRESVASQLEASRIRMGQGKEAREAARAARAAAKGAQPADPEAAKAERKAAAERAKSMTKVLVPLASIGSREALEEAFAMGADLSKAVENGVVPAVAAIRGGHAEVAKWLMERQGHGQELSRWGSQSELSAAVEADDAQLCEWIAKRRPWQASKQAVQESQMFDAALRGSPKAAAWLIGSGLAGSGNKPRSFDWRGSPAGSIAKAAKAGDMRSAEAIFGHLAKSFEGGVPANNAWGSLSAQFFDRALRADDPELLAWGMGKSQDLAKAAMRPLPGYLVTEWRGYWMGREGPSSVQLAKRVQANGAAKLSTTLPMWAACVGAVACLDLLLAVDAFRAMPAMMQAEPEKYLWEAGIMSVTDPAVAALLEGAGYDFDKRSDEGWCHAALILADGRPTVKWLEWIGKSKPHQLSGAPEGSHGSLEGRSPFALASQVGYSANAAQLAKWQSVCEKAAMRSGAGRSRATKEVKQQKALSRRL